MKPLLVIISAVIMISCGVSKQENTNPQVYLDNSTLDQKLLLQDNWVVESIRGKRLNDNPNILPEKLPQIDIDVMEMKYSGNDGCNNFFGAIIDLDASVIRFGVGAGTRMACEHMEIPQLFNQALPSVAFYSLEKLTLTLIDEQGEELIELKKMD